MGKNDYKWVTLTECQYLCHLTEMCFYFNWQARYTSWNTVGNCWLKWGLGMQGINLKAPTPSSIDRFGHRDTPGEKVLL